MQGGCIVYMCIPALEYALTHWCGAVYRKRKWVVLSDMAGACEVQCKAEKFSKSCDLRLHIHSLFYFFTKHILISSVVHTFSML